MFKRLDWLHLHGQDGGDSSSSDSDSSASGSEDDEVPQSGRPI